jgi:hypothetical protein
MEDKYASQRKEVYYFVQPFANSTLFHPLKDMKSFEAAPEYCSSQTIMPNDNSWVKTR